MALIGALWGKTMHISQAFPGAQDQTSHAMRNTIKDWFDLYYATAVKDEEDPCQRIPCTVVSKLQKACFSEYEATVKPTTPKGKFMSRCQAELDKARKKAVQLSMIGGEAWIKPMPGPDRFTFVAVRRDAVSILGRDAYGAVTDMICTEDTAADGGAYHLLERRTVRDGYLTIVNKLYFSKGNDISLGQQVPLNALPQYAVLRPEYTFKERVGSIGMVSLKMPTENTVDGSLDGVSVYAPADRLIHNINHNEWLLDQEFDNGAIRVIAPADMLDKPFPGDEEKKLGRSGRAFKVGVYEFLEGDPEAMGVTVFSPALREQSFLARKTEYLRNVETLIGIKRGLLSEVEAAQRTAKEITSSEGDYNLTVQDLWEMWDTADREALRLCDVLGQLYNICDSSRFDPAKDLTITWGNGVLYDRDKEWAEIMHLVSAGLLKPELALAWKYDLPHETAEDLAKIRKDYMPEMESLLRPGEE